MNLTPWATLALLGLLSLGDPLQCHGASDLAGALPPPSAGELRIATYNVDNYVTISRRIGGKLKAAAGKPLTERETVAKTIASLHADILLLEEMGSAAELEDLRNRLHQHEVDYPYVVRLEGEDPTRHLVLLSRFPLIENHSRGDIPLTVNGSPLHSPRGLLDVSVEPHPGETLHILGVHLKAKVEVPDYDSSAMRGEEATFLRRQVSEILSKNPSERLVVLGDFNDTINSKAITEITGKPGSRYPLRALPLVDDRGECWTEFWEWAGVYSRIDYIMVSEELESEIETSESKIARFPDWREASDHCPLVLSLRMIPTKKNP